MTEDLAVASVAKQRAVVYAADYLNKIGGDRVEHECREKLKEGCDELVLNFSKTELVNSVGISILLGIIDSAANRGTRVIFSDVKDETVELFDMLGVTRHVEINKQAN